MIATYLEIGRKRTFAAAVDWPGWSRSGRDEAAALQALLDYGPRYVGVVRGAGIDLRAPAEGSALSVVERLPGNTTTDFGAPGTSPAADARPVDQADLERFRVLLAAYWRALDAALAAATGRELRRGPRGGGRDLEAILRHVLEADAAYLAQLGWKPEKGEGGGLDVGLIRTRRAIAEGLAAAVRGEIPVRGPRGGARWTPRTFVRRVAWHTLDHAWEIEDRLL